MLILLCAVSCLLFSAFILGKNCIGLFVAFAICFGVIPGCCINPIQIGAAPLTETELASLVDQFADKDDYSVKWVVDGSWTVANLCAAYGAGTLPAAPVGSHPCRRSLPYALVRKSDQNNRRIMTER